MQHKPLLKYARFIKWVLKTFLIATMICNANKETPTPARLKKQETATPKKTKRFQLKITPELLLIIIVISVTILLPIILLATGCMESTTYYNGRII